MKRKYLIFFPVRRDIMSFPLQAWTQPCLTASMEKYSHSLWPDLFVTQIPLCPLYAQATDSAQDHPDQCSSSLPLETTSPWKPYRPELFSQSWRKCSFSEKHGIQKQSRVFWEFCLLSSPLSYVIWKPYVSMGYRYKSKGESPVFKQDTFYCILTASTT